MARAHSAGAGRSCSRAGESRPREVRARSSSAGPGSGALLKYELVVSCSRRRVPGALGLALRKALYPSLLGACGRNVVFGQNVVLRHPHKIRIGDNVVIDDNCLLDAKGETNRGITHRQRRLHRPQHASCRARTATSSSATAPTSASTARCSRRAACTIGRDTLLAAYCYVIGGDHDFSDPSRAGARAGPAFGRRRDRRRARGWAPAPRFSTASRSAIARSSAPAPSSARRCPTARSRSASRRASSASASRRGRRRESAASRERPQLNVLQVCDHLGWEGSRMHGVKRLFSWMIPRFDRDALQRLAGQPAQEGPVGGDARGAGRRHHLPAQVEVRSGDAAGAAEDHRSASRSTSCTCTATARRRSAGWPAAMRGMPTILHEHANLTDTPWFQKVADRLLEPCTDIAHRGVEEHRRLRASSARQMPPEKVKVVYLGRAARGVQPRARAPRRSRRRGASSASRPATSRSARSRGCTTRRATPTWSRPRGCVARSSARRRGSSWSAKARCAPALEAQARALGLGDRFVFAGFARDVARDALGVRPERVSRRCGRARR